MLTPTRYHTRRFAMDAVQYDGSDASVEAIARLIGVDPTRIDYNDGVWVDTHDAEAVRVWPHDYVVKTGDAVEVIKPGPFLAQFERVDGAVG